MESLFMNASLTSFASRHPKWRRGSATLKLVRSSLPCPMHVIYQAVLRSDYLNTRSDPDPRGTRYLIPKHNR